MWLGKLVTDRKAMINLNICSFKISPADFGSSKNLSGSCKPKDDMFNIKWPVHRRLSNNEESEHNEEIVLDGEERADQPPAKIALETTTENEETVNNERVFN